MHAKGRAAGSDKKRTAGSLRQVDVEEILRICTSSSSSSSTAKAGHSQGLTIQGNCNNENRSRDLWVFNRQHNGFGNQLFQYVFSRLLAESTGRLWRTSLLDPALGESPWRNNDRPPNSESGWLLLRSIFPSADEVTSTAGRLDMTIVRANPDMNASMSSCLEPQQRCVISDRPYDQHLSKQPLVSQMISAFYAPECEAKCLFLIGYYQEPLFFLPFRSRVDQWLGAAQDPPTRHLSPRLEANDIVAHVRCCQHSGGGCDWLFLPFEYYDAVLSRLVARKPPTAKVFVVAPCRTDCPMIESFQRKYGATHITPGKEVHHHQKGKMLAAMASDFRFLQQARTLVLGKSTYGFWAGFLSRNTSEIHIPVESRRHPWEKVPLVQDDARFIFHNPGLDLWFGQPQGGDSAVRYEERGRWFGPKTLDENGNYIITKSS